MNKIFISAYSGFVLYVILLLIWGPEGLISYKQMNEYREELIANVSELKLKENRFLHETRELNLNEEKIVVNARNFGYLKENERIIDVSGFKKSVIMYNAGILINDRPQIFSNREMLMVFSCFFSLVVLIFCLSFGHSQGLNMDKRRAGLGLSFNHLFRTRKNRYHSL
ncbi:MAG: septum formation initiator family protein [Spirochaetales bacterium]|nr:septum formation initiator family protein [Spirochaetales bacterium]